MPPWPARYVNKQISECTKEIPDSWKKKKKWPPVNTSIINWFPSIEFLVCRITTKKQNTLSRDTRCLHVNLFIKTAVSLWLPPTILHVVQIVPCMVLQFSLCVLFTLDSKKRCLKFCTHPRNSTYNAFAAENQYFLKDQWPRRNHASILHILASSVRK